MDTEQKFVVWAVMLWILLSLISLAGCDYWPPALQAEIEQLRAQLNDALDEQAKAQEELAALRARMPPQGNAGGEPVSAPAALPELASFGQPAQPPPSAGVSSGAAEPVSSRHTEPPRATVAKGSAPPLRLEHPLRTGPAVVKLQRLLRDQRMPVRVDGIFGRETEAAVGSFQRTRRLTPDGIAGPATHAALRRKPASVVARQVWLQRPPVTGNDVRFIQRALRRAGYRVAVDGRYGLETDVAITRFQRRHGLEPDGIVGPATWRVLTRRDAAR